MNNLIITTRQSPVRLLVDYVATTILWTLFALFIFLFAIDLLTGYYWQSEARSRLQFYFLLAVANAVVLIVWHCTISCVLKNSSIMQHTNIRRKNMQRA